MFYNRSCISVLVSFVLLFPLAGQESQTNRIKVGLVLSGGAAKGISHIGVLKVIEEAGITLDYIGGTSMGSIVGGLYSLGYDAKTLEDLALNQDWKALLTDEVQLSSISVEEKEESRKYFLSIPVEKSRIKLPSGLNSGQNISMLLSTLMGSYYDVTNFNEFPIPFYCIATDIVNGTQVVFHRGYLPEVIRASMAIPTIFTPVEIDGKLLVDGGLVNNFPVKEMKEMGADIIIGVNCGFRSYSKQEINSITTVLEQSMYILSAEKSYVNNRLCDILIEPEFEEGNSMASFSNTSELIKIGEDAARLHFSELKKLADSINSAYGITEKKEHKSTNTIFINKMIIEGLDKVSKTSLLGKLKITGPSKIYFHELNTSISRAYGTQFFESVTYKIDHKNDSNILIIKVKEKPNTLFRIGGHYDTDFDASILLNTTIRNALIKGSKLSFDLKLGRNPAFEARYLLTTSYSGPKLIIPAWKLGWIPDFEFLFSYRDYDIFEYDEGHKVATYDYQNTGLGIKLKSSISNSIELGTGLLLEYSIIKPTIYQQAGPDTVYNTNLNSNVYLKVDSYDEYVYPNRGARLYSKFEFVKDINDRAYPDFYRISASLNKAIPISEKFTIISNIYGGSIIGDSVPADYLYYTGGLVLNDYEIGVFPFVGLELFEKAEKNALIIGLDFQYEFLTSHFLQVRGNVGKTASFVEDLINPDDIFFGYGITYGFRSLIGPLELSIMKNNLRSNILTYVNIGYRF